MSCPLCGSKDTYLFQEPIFYRCKVCSLVFKDPKVWPSIEEEKERYLKHNNSLEDKGYRDFLLGFIRPLSGYLKPGMRCLDYGCGPSPSLSILMKERGFDCKDYDPHFFRDDGLLAEKYDLITCHEVIEHFRHPAEEFERLFGMLSSGGILAVRTQLVPDDFKDWWYHSDNTHIVFYSKETLDRIAEKYGLYCFTLATGSVFIFSSVRLLISE